MKSETKNCQNCKNDFTIELDDFSFYEKIKVPPPTFCPECRMIRRLAWRNVRSLYKRDCLVCHKSLISMYPEDGAPVLCTNCWNGDGWDPKIYGKDYDFSKTFFDQLIDLFYKAPRFFAYHTGLLINSEYTNYSADNKNCYLSYSVIGCEDVMYSETIDKTKNSIDCYGVQKLDNCSYNIDCDSNYNTHFAIKSQNCIDSYFLFDCINCQECCLSTNLRNQKYVFKNKKLSKDEYQKSIEGLKLNTYTGFVYAKNILNSLMRDNSIHKYAQIYNSQNVSGDYISNSRNVYYGFDVHDSENIKYGSRVLLNCKDSYDLQGLASGELIYEAVAASFGTYRDYFCYITLGSKDCQYSGILKNCSDCFGCFGLINAQYCIFNKQYSKEEYFELVDKIKKHMMDLPYIDSLGRIYRYGEFFPFEMSPFGINETVAIDYYRINKEESISKQYKWKEKEKIDYKITKNSDELPDNISDVDESILAEVISCPNKGNSIFQCTTAFRITKNELQFLKQKKLPLPRFCPNCRHYQRLEYRNLLKFYNKKCMCNKNHVNHNGICEEEFLTSYSPDRPEIVYCERCYQQEVY